MNGTGCPGTQRSTGHCVAGDPGTQRPTGHCVAGHPGTQWWTGHCVAGHPGTQRSTAHCVAGTRVHSIVQKNKPTTGPHHKKNTWPNGMTTIPQWVLCRRVLWEFHYLLIIFSVAETREILLLLQLQRQRTLFLNIPVFRITSILERTVTKVKFVQINCSRECNELC